MGTLTLINAIITALGGTLGLAKSTLEIRQLLKGLFKKKIEINEAFNKISKDRKVLEDLYNAIEMGKTLFQSIYKKLIISYLAIAIIFLFLLIVVILGLQYFLSQPTIVAITNFEPIISIVLFLFTYFSISKLSAVPVKITFPELNLQLQRAKNIIYNLINLDQHDKLSPSGNLSNYKLRYLARELKLISKNEMQYIESYLTTCSLRDTLEIYWINEKLQQSREGVLKSAVLKPAILGTIVEIISDGYALNEDGTIKQDYFEAAMKKAKLGAMLAKLNQQNFYYDDFKARAKIENGIFGVLDNIYYSN